MRVKATHRVACALLIRSTRGSERSPPPYQYHSTMLDSQLSGLRLCSAKLAPVALRPRRIRVKQLTRTQFPADSSKSRNPLAARRPRHRTRRPEPPPHNGTSPVIVPFRTTPPTPAVPVGLTGPGQAAECSTPSAARGFRAARAAGIGGQANAPFQAGWGGPRRAGCDLLTVRARWRRPS